MMKVICVAILLGNLGCGQLKPKRGQSSERKSNEPVIYLEPGSKHPDKTLLVEVNHRTKPKARPIVQEDVDGIFVRDCKGCHFGAVLNLSKFPYTSPDMSMRDLIATSLQRMRRNDLKRMPPVNETKTSDEDIHLIQLWFDGGLKTKSDLGVVVEEGILRLKVAYRVDSSSEWRQIPVSVKSALLWTIDLNAVNEKFGDLMLEISDNEDRHKKILMKHISMEMKHIEIDW